VEECTKAGTSIAIFAPGWTWEAYSNKGEGDYVHAAHKLWVAEKGRYEKCMHISYPPSFTDSVASFISARPVPGTHDFYTNFGQGFGSKFFRKGQPVHQGSWFHLALQNPQPSWPSGIHLIESATEPTSAQSSSLPWFSFIDHQV